MMNRPTFSDVYDINPKTGALILGRIGWMIMLPSS